MVKISIIVFTYILAFLLAYISYLDTNPTSLNHVSINNTSFNFFSTFLIIVLNNSFIWIILFLGVFTFGILSVLILFYNIYSISLLVLSSLKIHSFDTIFKIVFIHGLIEFFAFSMVVFFALEFTLNANIILNHIKQKVRFITLSYSLVILSAIIETIIYNSIL